VLGLKIIGFGRITSDILKILEGGGVEVPPDLDGFLQPTMLNPRPAIPVLIRKSLRFNMIIGGVVCVLTS
jgi:hypothetical protein